MEIKLILKPHPACQKWGEMIDIFSNDTPLPWATVHIDTFHQAGTDSRDNELYQLLYTEKREVTVTLVVEAVR